MNWELGGEPGGPETSGEVSPAITGATDGGSSVAMRSGVGIECDGALDASSCLPPGSVPLQQSSAFEEGPHFPFLQQSSVFCVSLPLLKQSKGVTSSRTAKEATTMWKPRRIFSTLADCRTYVGDSTLIPLGLEQVELHLVARKTTRLGTVMGTRGYVGRNAGEL